MENSREIYSSVAIKNIPKLVPLKDVNTERYCNILLKAPTWVKLAPVCNPTLQVIGLHRPCMEKAGVAVNALQLYLTLKY